MRSWGRGDAAKGKMGALSLMNAPRGLPEMLRKRPRTLWDERTFARREAERQGASTFDP